jgi:hypothetical protein
MTTKSKAPSAAGNAKARSGGGVQSNKLVKVGVKAGPPNTKIISPSAVAIQGNKQGDHRTDGGAMRRPPDPLIQGTKPQVAMGNAVALNVGKGGPGVGRTVHKSGSQGTWGPTNPGSAPLPRTPGGGPGGFGFTKGDQKGS